MFRFIYSYITFSLLYQFKTGMSTEPSVLIIGAGPAGIAAATKLLENSVTNIKILEAENRIGGRINSVKFGDAFVDLGAEYCHGGKGNIVYELAKDLNLLEPEVNSYENLYYSNGERVETFLVKDLKWAIENYNQIANYNTTGLSMGDLFLHTYNTTILKKYENNSQKLKILKEGVRFAEGVMIISKGSFTWNDLSAQSAYSEYEDHHFFKWKGCGHRIILDILMKKYPTSSNQLSIDDKIILNQKVTKINWHENHSVIVQTHDNTYTADYVIFTPSVGVLKHQKDTLFTPPLPLSKINAIDSIGLGGTMKTFMHFPERWWKDNDTMFLFLWNEEDLKITDFKLENNDIPWIAQIRLVHQSPENPNVLGSWITGDLVDEIEKLPIETIKKGFKFVLNKFLGTNYNITDFDDFIASRWYSNENFRGVHSYTKTGYYNKNLSYPAKLAEPLNGISGKPALLFAGEATSLTHFSTVHGAIETGHREAERIIELRRKREYGNSAL